MGKWAETEAAYFGRKDAKEEKEAMKNRVLPILFNTDMVQAILDGRKTTKRQVMKPQPLYYTGRRYIFADDCCPKKWEDCDNIIKTYQYQSGDILYVRETWAFIPCIGCNGDYARGTQPCYDFQAVEYDDGDSISDWCFVYRADCKTPERITWRPSIHMPKEAARIWIKVTDVRVELLQNMNTGDFLAEGVVIRPEAFNDPENAYWQAKEEFIHIWDATVKKAEKDRYGWDANPWVWVIEFERCKKPVEE